MKLQTQFLVAVGGFIGVAIVAMMLWSYASSSDDQSQFLPRDISPFERLTIDDVIAQLGDPVHRSEYAMDECVGELRVTLFNTYSPELPNLADIEIQELTWQFPDNLFTVWLHRPDGKWIVLETFRYETEAVF